MAIIFTTRFVNSLDIDFPDYAPHGSNYKLIAGRGIDGGNSFTCSNGQLVRNNIAFGTTTFPTVTLRTQWGFIYTDNFIDDSGVATRPGQWIFSFADPISLSSSETSCFSGQLAARPNGMLSLYITGGGLFDSGRLAVNSATGVLNYDGRMHGIQFSLQLLSHSIVVYNVVVNNVSVISGMFDVSARSMACGGKFLWGWANTGCVERAAIVQVSVHGTHVVGFNGRETSITEFEIENSINIIDYPPNNAINAVINPCTPPTTGVLTITKVAIPDSGSHSFGFTVGGGLSPSTFNLLNGQSRVYTGVSPGTYSVVENEDPLWTPSYVNSTGGTDNLHIGVTPFLSPTITVTNTGEQPAPSGLYFINPFKATKHDSYYESVEKKIPNPIIKTALVGE